MKKLLVKIVKKIIFLIIFSLIMKHYFMSNISNNNNNTNKKPKPKTVSVTVQQGDTIWSIAENIKKDNQDVRKLVYEIKKENNVINSIIVPGQILNISLD